LLREQELYSQQIAAPLRILIDVVRVGPGNFEDG
jgi:hypothetical protein